MTITVKDASGVDRTIKTNDDITSAAGTPSTNVVTVQGAASGYPTPIVEGNSAAPISAATMPTGGVGLTGWLSAIWYRLAGVVLAAGNAVIGRVGIDQTTDGVTNLVAAKQSGNWTVTNVSGTVSLPTGAATSAKQPAIGTAGSASADVITVQGVAGGVAIPTTVMGGTPAHYLSAASTNQINVKASAGTLLNVTAINTTATVYYLKLHDTASTPTAGTTAVVQCYAIPASTSGNGFTISVPMTFSSGIAFTLVGGIADNDTSNAATGVTVDFVYR
jgi:hypothetical protein